MDKDTRRFTAGKSGKTTTITAQTKFILLKSNQDVFKEGGSAKSTQTMSE